MAAAGAKYSSPKPALHFDTTHTFLSSYTSSSTPNPIPATQLLHPPLPLLPSTPHPLRLPQAQAHPQYALCRRRLPLRRLLVESLQVPGSFVVRLPVGEAVGVDVTLVDVDANYCPGAVMFLFQLPRKGKYVHTGDFRFCDSMRLDPDLGGFVGADAIFLDTTYCNPRYAFPSHCDSIGYIVDTIEMMKAENANMSILLLIATYVVGKERILLEISRKCNCMVYVDSKKMGILRAIGVGDCGVFTEEESASDVPVTGWNLLGETWPYFRPIFVKMK